MLLKAVPDSEALEVDLDRGRVRRAPATLRLNPFDARALQVARKIRRPGETITAVSMGPPGAEVVLREAFAAGADRAILISDPALAGSDAQVTARVLLPAVRRSGVGLVLLGARSSDAETGQVPPELAGLLGWPLVAGARQLLRAEAGPGFEVTADGRSGWVQWAVDAPFVLSTGEKIAKPPKPSDADRAAALERPIDRWDLSRVGLAATEVGDAGSPTRVESAGEGAPRRSGRSFVEGPVPERVDQAFAALALLPERGTKADPVGAPGGAPASPSTAWVVAVDETGALDDVALPMLGAIATALPGAVRTVVIPGGSPTAATRRSLGEHGAHRVLHLPGSLPAGSAADLARALVAAARRDPPDLALCVSDPFGREVAGRWAAAAGIGLVGDAMGLRPGPDGSVRWTKPAFGGEYEVTIVGRTRPTLGTVRPGVFAPGPVRSGPSELEIVTGPPLEARERSPRRRAAGSEEDPRLGDLERARRVVTVGMGIGGPEGIDRLVPYLGRWGAALGATRRVVDAGWLPVHRQVGLTGRSLAPDLAILLGVGKAQNHVIGLRRAGAVLAVNPDPTAPVFQYADAGVVAGWEEALPALDPHLTRRGPLPSARPS
ncbi:MAG TPA: FAD-binding protein [Thermoplasmata archaeon]|nr:FAD-binding protein [Thermoplasmata archaeon]